jgi:hypothetical protein
MLNTAQTTNPARLITFLATPRGWPTSGGRGPEGPPFGLGLHKGAKKRRVESCLALDVNELRRAGALVPGACGTLSWGCNDNALASLAFRADADALILSYFEQGVMIEQRIALAHSPAKFGGARVYFVCPGHGCGRCVSKLYFARGALRCRPLSRARL